MRCLAACAASSQDLAAEKFRLVYRVQPSYLSLDRRPARPTYSDATYTSWPLLTAAAATRLAAYLEPPTAKPAPRRGCSTDLVSSPLVVSAADAGDLSGAGVLVGRVREAVATLLETSCDPATAIAAYAQLDAEVGTRRARVAHASRTRRALVAHSLHTPALSTTQHMPALSTTQHMPALSTTQQTPALSTTQHMPALSTTQQTPALSTTQHTPALSTTQHTPALSTTQHTLALSTTQHTPPVPDTLTPPSLHRPFLTLRDAPLSLPRAPVRR